LRHPLKLLAPLLGPLRSHVLGLELVVVAAAAAALALLALLILVVVVPAAAAAAAAAALLRRHLLLLGVALARAALAALAAIARHDNHLDVFALGAALRGRVLGHRLGLGPVARCCRLGALGAGLGHRLGALGPLGRLGSTARAALPLAVVVVVVLFLVVVVLLLVALLLVALLLLALAEHHARKRAALLPLPRLALRARALRGGPAEPLVVEGELLVVLELAAAVGALDLQE